jgi:hypothetical protein
MSTSTTKHAPFRDWPRSLVAGTRGVAPLYRTRAELFAARVATSPAFTVFDRHPVIQAGYTVGPAHTTYDVTRDGKHFVFVRSISANAPILVVMNWLGGPR